MDRGACRRSSVVRAATIAALAALLTTAGGPACRPARAQTLCAASFYRGAAPSIPATAARGSRMLCPGPYAALTSTLTRTGLWSAEHLTGAQAEAAARLVRTDTFHAEAGLAHDERAELSDYRHSGFDRGHLTPNGDEGNAADASATFTLSQMVPQDPDNNRHLWEEIESTTRTIAKRDGDVWIVTGALFRSATLRIIGGRVYVPTHLYKAVYDPTAATAGVYVARNAPGRAYEAISLDAFRSSTGIDPFPGLTGPIRTIAALPPVEVRRRRYGD